MKYGWYLLRISSGLSHTTNIVLFNFHNKYLRVLTEEETKA